MKTIQMILCALFAALTAVLSQVAIPIGPVPISLATFSVFLSGALLGARLGGISQCVYVLLGAVGVPVFAGFKSGLGALVGPTGGYIVGYVFAAFVVGLIAERSGGKIWKLALAMVAGFLTYMVLGTGWFMILTGKNLAAALMVCVIPFLPGDGLKMALAVLLARQLQPVLSAMMEKGFHNVQGEKQSG